MRRAQVPVCSHETETWARSFSQFRLASEPRLVMVEIETTDEHSAITAPGLRLRFEWAGDRWCHSLDLASNGAWLNVARSVEGNASRDGPERVVSPTFQQLQIQRTGAGAQALLVGQSGPHHFSAVFQLRDIEGVVYVEADIVDRCRSTVEALASTYRVELDSGAITQGNPSGVVWQREDWQGRRLSFLPWGPPERPARIALAEAGRGATQVQAEASLEGGSPTQRWFYQWRWDAPGEPSPRS